MTEVEVNAGVCGFRTVVRVDTSGGDTTVEVESDCPHVAKMAEAIPTVDAMREIFEKGNSEVLAAGSEHLAHVTCPVPVGILKAIEAQAGLALPRDAAITFRSAS